MVVTRRSRNKVIAAKFQDILFKHWLTEKKTADGAFEFLLKSHRAHIFEIFDNLEIWVSFVTKLDKGDDYKTIFSVLKKRLEGRELANIIYDAGEVGRTALLARKLEQELWLSQGENAEGIFNLLHLNDAETALFKKRDLATWVSYVTKLDAKNADEIIFSVLNPPYTQKDFAAMLTAAKKVEKTEDLAIKLEKLFVQSLGK
ncbi:hypothetical protein PHYSODRAFT_527317 [Phytophthora sojae]|uniref:RXLR phytopathogen effector protein WY-domain domain-containing protein n=1 Tax=Phytophthora sojae (strain P6497) TaxID=1094619 RepID=G5A7N2_PHYSP|nr:hypothetical protein PHYSODRAFT_527317 [Phytophthora sojae]EGZ07908.1 hypothetical protein PHYSODRAFT_527317 [Phytophthora sojae]|eukprot:XP_009536080.1 hypothetical protein PHYSODRAFT_527317 [Phytophthora sojae]